MNEEWFWEVIATACCSDLHEADQWCELLQAELEQLTPNDIIEWNHIFDRLAARAYAVDLWGAAWLINGGASDENWEFDDKAQLRRRLPRHAAMYVGQ